MSRAKLFCHACGASKPEGQTVCPDCGSGPERMCAACGTASFDPGAKFCGECGSRLPASGAALLPATVPASGEEDEWQTEIRHATVLFVDLVSSTELVATLDAEGAMQRLRPMLEAMSLAVEQSGGVVQSTLGDGIMALFGAVRTEERHAELACQAALTIRSLIAGQPGGLAVRAGLHSGEIVVHHRSSDPTGLKPFGVALHVASRLLSKAGPGDICLTDACRSLIRRACTTRPLGEHALRGVPQPVRLHLLDSMAPGQDASRAATGGMFLGRRRELDVLLQCLDSTLAGIGGTVRVLGAAGTGKSRLCREFAAACRDRAIPVFEASAQPYGTAPSLRSFGTLLGSAYFGLPHGGADDAAQVVSAVLDRIDSATPANQALVCDLLGVSSPDRSILWTAQARVARLADVFTRLARQPGGTPKVLVFEDAHWADEPTKVLLSALAGAVAGTRTMLLLNQRATGDDGWLRDDARSIEIDELSPEDTERLVEDLVGSAADLAGLRRQVVDRSGGNPFFAGELVRSLADAGVLAGTPGAFRPGASASGATLPLTVQAVIGSRIDRLARADRDLVYVSAVIGREFEVAVLRNVVGQDCETLLANLDHLSDLSLFSIRQRARTAVCEFRHPLIQEVAYNMQLKERRRHLHGAVARTMRQLYPDGDGDIAGIIAFHLEQAGQIADAAAFTARAARWIGQHSASAAIERWHKVRALTEDGKEAAQTSLRIEANGQIAWLGWREGLTAEQAVPFLQEALASARDADHPLTPLLMLAQGRIAQVSGGDPDAFVSVLAEAAAMAGRQGEPGRVATLQAALSHAHGWSGLLREALAANDAALAGAHLVTDVDQQFLNYDVKDWASGLRGRILLRLGMIAPARRCFDEVIERGASIDPTVTVIGHLGYTELGRHLGDSLLAEEHSAHIDALARRSGSAYLKVYAAASKAIAHGAAARLDEAIREIRFCLELQERTGAAVEFKPELLAYLAEYQRRAGMLDQALATATAATSLARTVNARLPLCRATITQAEASFLIRGKTARDDANAMLRTAEGLLNTTGAELYRPLLADAQALLAGD